MSKTIYEKSVREIMIEYFEKLSLGDEFSKEQIIEYFKNKYPRISRNTIVKHLLYFSINTKVHKGEKWAQLVKINMDKYRLYDEKRDIIKTTDEEKEPDISETIENPAMFAMEKHLEDFLIENWEQTMLGKEYDIFTEDGEVSGNQYETDIGIIDILAISKDKKTLLVIELKKGKSSDTVVGQIQRYMGYVKKNIAELSQNVKGIIIALDDDPKIRYALMVAKDIEFYRYKINFELLKD